MSPNLSCATFGGGCFWCTEAVFQKLKGVEKVVSGYTGGAVNNPTYEAICTGTTGHAEVVQIFYNPFIVSYEELLQVFFSSHDPTTLNRQGNDIGTQYRSIIFTQSDHESILARKVIKRLEDENIFMDPIVTQVEELKKFYSAETYHQNYYNDNASQGYCQFVIAPKVEKIEKLFSDMLSK